MPLTERLEMRLDQATVERLDGWRDRQSDRPSRSEAIRCLMERGLDEEVRISGGEKLILTMLRDLYRRLNVDGEIDPDFVGEVLAGGHYWALDWEVQGLFHGHRDDRRTVTETVDVLDMWTFLEEGYEALSTADKEKVRNSPSGYGSAVRFLGFDGNHDDHFGIAVFLIEKMGRFRRFAGRELNSHHPVIDGYRAMIRTFEPIRATLIGRSMTADEVIAVLDQR